MHEHDYETWTSDAIEYRPFQFEMVTHRLCLVFVFGHCSALCGTTWLSGVMYSMLSDLESTIDTVHMRDKFKSNAKRTSFWQIE
jgi:hypothetical protein